MHDLNDLIVDSPWTVTYAMGGNSRGQIVGWSNDTGGPSQAYVATPIILGDLTLDARVDAADLAMLLASWGPCRLPPNPCPGDIDPPDIGDGIVGPADLAVLLANWQ